MAKQPQRRPNPPQTQNKPANRPATAPVRRSEKKESIWNTGGGNELLFHRQNYIWIGAGMLLVLLGIATMSGGEMPDPNKWEPERIYSFRRITLAPLMMLAGIVVVVVGIFKRTTTTPAGKNTATTEPANTSTEA